MTPSARSAQSTKEGCPIPELTNLWYACPKWHAERFSWHAAFTVVRIYFLFPLPDQFFCIAKSMCIYAHIWLRTDWLWITVATKNTASEICLHKSRGLWCVDWIFITGAKTGRWLGLYVTLDKGFCNLIFKYEQVAAPVTSTFSFLIAFLEDDFY